MMIQSAREVMVPLFLCGICTEDDLLHEGLHSVMGPKPLPILLFSKSSAARTSDV